MTRPRANRATTLALYAIVALLAANLVAVLARNNSASMLPSAFAGQAPIAGGAGLFVMPAQLSGNRWGCYLMDVDRGTLCVYEYLPGTRELTFNAARNFSNDTKLGCYNTTPKPQEILDLVNKQNQPVRGLAVPDTQEKKGSDN